MAVLDATAPQGGLCYTCHGAGTTFDVESAFAASPPNDAATDRYFSHPVSAASAAAHVMDTDDEFGGRLERHAVCADCHNPHNATNARPAQSTSGWTASGDIAGATGVEVANGAAGSTPSLSLIDRARGQGSLVYEYQLCFKCHSGWTVLPTRSTANPSWWALDKAIEFNPANAAYHPVEAPGRNVSAQMAASLAGTSPFKAWDLSVDSTVRCTSCHGDPSTVDQTAGAAPKSPTADAYEPAHASSNRGILIGPYRDRDLKTAGETYDSSDFALCYLCHAERPFVDPNVDPSAADTAFPLHGFHLGSLPSSPGLGTSIDEAGGGPGLAICAECHFRIHSTAIAYRPGDSAPFARSDGSGGLVSFAPNVVGLDGAPPSWNAPNGLGVGSCALTCHAYAHLAAEATYSTAPGTGFTASPTSGSVGRGGLEVQFVDATRYVSGLDGTWAWSFGDGTISSLRNPTHTYLSPGTYTVSLTVTRSSDGLSTTLTRTAYIAVAP